MECISGWTKRSGRAAAAATSTNADRTCLVFKATATSSIVRYNVSAITRQTIAQPDNQRREFSIHNELGLSLINFRISLFILEFVQSNWPKV